MNAGRSGLPSYRRLPHLEKRLLLCKELLAELDAWDSPAAFAGRYLRHYLTASPAPFHAELYDLMASSTENKREAVAAPRGHGKSVLMGLVYPLWAICTGRKRFIVIISSSSTISEGFLGAIIRELKENGLIRMDFGELVGREKWTSTDILCSNGVRVVAKGVGSSLRGMRSFESRPDLVICDDLEDDEGVLSAEQRRKLESWFNRSVLNLPGPEGDIIVVGTILHYDSLLSKLLKKWQGKRYRALGTDGAALWSGYYDAERLKKIKQGDGGKEGIGSIAFECEYQNNPISPEEQLIREEWISYYKPEDLYNQELLIATAIDPALGSSSSGDYSAMVTVGQVGGKIYVLEADIKRRRPAAIADAAVRNFQRWSGHSDGEEASKKKSHFLCLAVETNVFQVVLKDMLEDISRREKLFIPIRGVKNFSDKTARIASLSALIENGTILFNRDLKLLIEQLIEFPRGSHDDGPDALEMAVRQLRHHSTPRIRFI
ncbi:MAG: phage terminase large subunit [Candidatus Brocadiales bacterium]|nr:phage terminase large subunit [Candidatus Bathyanammoxibius amoris]